jgi:glycosyltransferase involved in cell wall biosynthesis
MMPKVIEVVYNLPAEVFLQRHIEAIVNRFNVQIIARHQDAVYGRSASVANQVEACPSYIMPNFDHMERKSKLASFRYLIPSPLLWLKHLPLGERVLLAYFKQLHPDLIHFHAASLATMMAWIPKELGIPYTVSIRGSDIQVFPLRLDSEKQGIRQVLEEAAGVHAVCDVLGQQARYLAPGICRPNTIYTTVPIPDTLPEYIPPEDGKLRLLSVGRLHWRKSYPDLLVCLRDMRDEGIEVKLTIVGSGAEQTRLYYWTEQLGIRDQIRWIGKASFDQIKTLLISSDGFIQSSLVEGFSNSVAEAMAWGCPVFATDVGGTAELIRNGETGFLLKPLHPEQWVEPLRQISDQSLMENVRQQAYLLAREQFAAQVHARKFMAFYDQVISAPKRLPNPIGSQPARINPDDLRKICIEGTLEWQMGADQVIRALAEASRPASISLWITGSGLQEDELRYLAYFLGFAHWEVNPTPSEIDADMVIYLPEEPQGRWQVSSPGGDTISVPYGDGEQLERTFRQVLKIKPVGVIDPK